MKKMKRLLILGIVAALCLIATPVVALYSCDPVCDDPNGSDICCFGPGTPISTNLVTPDAWNGNPTCQDLGFDNGTKFDPNPVSSGDILWNFDPADPFVTWSSSFPIDAVIMKGGDIGANVYYYSPASTGDSGLATPDNPSGYPAGLSHIDFCFTDNNGCDCPENECSTGICDQAGECIFVEEGTQCTGGVCDGDGNCGGTPVPEFPSLALPMAMAVGLLGAVLFVRKTKEN
jgi:hypothetical protein